MLSAWKHKSSASFSFCRKNVATFSDQEKKLVALIVQTVRFSRNFWSVAIFLVFFCFEWKVLDSEKDENCFNFETFLKSSEHRWTFGRFRRRHRQESLLSLFHFYNIKNRFTILSKVSPIIHNELSWQVKVIKVILRVCYTRRIIMHTGKWTHYVCLRVFRWEKDVKAYIPWSLSKLILARFPADFWSCNSAGPLR